METAEINVKRVYRFGGEHTDGRTDLKPLLGGKGANLAEMSRLGLPVPPGFTITTDVCTEYHQLGKEPIKNILRPEVREGVKFIEGIMGSEFGNPTNPLLLSVRSGARDSMPGMMDTVLDIGLNDEVVEGMAIKTEKPHFAWDSYRRFIQMYGDVVMKVNKYSNETQDVFETILEDKKNELGINTDQEMSVDDLKEVVSQFKVKILEITGKDFPQDPPTQLWNSIIAVFESWHTPRAIVYRRLNHIPEEWGTAVNVQAMVFGNMGYNSASGVAFTRDASTGQNVFNGEYLIDAQGEDVVAGIRTPHQISIEGSRKWAKLSQVTDEERIENFISLEEYLPLVYRQLLEIEHTLENHFKDMQDLEFTIQEEKLWILQTRNGKRSGAAMLKIGIDMLDEGMIDEKTFLRRMNPNKVNELLHPVFEKSILTQASLMARGLPASPGAASGIIVFNSEEATLAKSKGHKVILVRRETSPEDLAGMDAAEGILTARGGMTSHAAVVARGMGKPCVCGASRLSIDEDNHKMTVDGRLYKRGEWISIDGTTGAVHMGKVKTKLATLNNDFTRLLEIADRYSKMKVHANADTPETARIARKFGAEGIGLCRTEHMFFDTERIEVMREMILARDTVGRQKALDKLLPMQRADFESILEVMDGFPVTIRLLDPPLHEFLPTDIKLIESLANSLGLSVDEVKTTIRNLQETNPMLGHRGCRLGNTYPEITKMQVRAIIEASLNLKTRGINAKAEIMVPLVGTVNEFKMQVDIAKEEIKNVFTERHDQVEYKIGTMIEVPRAALVADQIARYAEFFSFGTNDLTQMTFGYSRDDAGKFLPIYLEKDILKENPFETIDQEGVGQLIMMGIQKGRLTSPKLTVGICGEHGGEPNSVEFCHQAGMNYVSCSPYRVPIAKVAAARAALN